MYLKEHKYTEWVKYSVPIGEREDVHVDAQPDMENCANGIAPQPNATADGAQPYFSAKRESSLLSSGNLSFPTKIPSNMP